MTVKPKSKTKVKAKASPDTKAKKKKHEEPWTLDDELKKYFPNAVAPPANPDVDLDCGKKFVRAFVNDSEQDVYDARIGERLIDAEVVKLQEVVKGIDFAESVVKGKVYEIEKEYTEMLEQLRKDPFITGPDPFKNIGPETRKLHQEVNEAVALLDRCVKSLHQNLLDLDRSEHEFEEVRAEAEAMVRDAQAQLKADLAEFVPETGPPEIPIPTRFTAANAYRNRSRSPSPDSARGAPSEAARPLSR